MTRRFDSKGVIAIIAAIALPVILLLASGTMDMGRAYVVKQRLQTAVDAAALVAQINAANATPETACQSVAAMNLALNANITSNGFLSTSTPTLVSCNYDSTAKKIVVTANISLNKTWGFAPSTVTATGYATLNNTNSNASEWIALYCYGDTAISSASSCASYGNLNVNQSSTSGATVSVTGPVCQSSINKGQLGSDCQTFNNRDSGLYINTNANLSGSTVDTSGNSCAQCNQAYFSGEGNINYGNTVITDLSLFFDNPFTLNANTSLTIGKNASFCYNGMSAQDATINVVNGGALGCVGYQDPHIDINGNSPGLVVSGNSSLYGRYISINNSSAVISDSTVTLTMNGNSFILHASNASVTNSTFNVGGAVALSSASMDLNNTHSNFSTINSGNAKITIENSSILTIPNSTSQLNNMEFDTYSGSTVNFNNYTTIDSSQINVDGCNSITNFNSDTMMTNTKVLATNGATFKLTANTNDSNIVGLTLNSTGKSSIIIQNINSWHTGHSIQGTVDGAGSYIILSTDSHADQEIQNLKNDVQIKVKNGGTLTIQ